jgi:hypothetical protein
LGRPSVGFLRSRRLPLHHGEDIARRLPRAVFNVRPDEGHLGGLGASHEILDALLAEWQRLPAARRV